MILTTYVNAILLIAVGPPLYNKSGTAHQSPDSPSTIHKTNFFLLTTHLVTGTTSDESHSRSPPHPLPPSSTAMNNGKGGAAAPSGKSGETSGGAGGSGSTNKITKTFSDEEEMQPTSTSSIERFDFFGEEGSLRDQDAGDPTNRDVI